LKKKGRARTSVHLPLLGVVDSFLGQLTHILLPFTENVGGEEFKTLFLHHKGWNRVPELLHDDHKLSDSLHLLSYPFGVAAAGAIDN
jgi:hypothetical protein